MHPSVATELGIMTALRTGDPVRDLALCAAVPLALDRLRDSVDTISVLAECAKERVQDLFAGGRYAYHRVELLEHNSSWGNQRYNDDIDHSELLMRVINRYVIDHVSLDGYSSRYDLVDAQDPQTLEAALRLEPLLATRKETTMKHLLDSNREIVTLSLAVLPPLDTWIPIDHDGGVVEIQYNEIEIPSTKKDARLKTMRKTFVLRSRAVDGPARMQAFVEQAFVNYKEVEMRKRKDDHARYMYVVDSSPPWNDTDNADGEEDDEEKKKNDEDGVCRFKRYALSEDKTMDSIFFDEKPAVLQLLDDFTDHTGKFAIEGFPNKLGFLLHGPPGTGKTSLIKAIAHYTKRHLVSISLAKIKTNQELLDAMTDLRFRVRGLDLPVKMRFQDLIFVMEDVDCASSVVQTRTDNAQAAQSNDISAMNGGENPLAKLIGLLGGDGPSGGYVAASNQADKLNLAGLFNVLDGVIDSPGRIVIMTTNHPEKLDPALIRPGRVNKKLHLAYMPPQQIQNMLEYYFGSTLAPQDAVRLCALPHESGITPAEVEEICAECEEITQAIDTVVKSVENRRH